MGPSAKALVPLLTEQIVKMDCERCRLKTEHYILKDDIAQLMCRCLRCGQVRKRQERTSRDHKPYPTDDRRPIYVA